MRPISVPSISIRSKSLLKHPSHTYGTKATFLQQFLILCVAVANGRQAEDDSITSLFPRFIPGLLQGRQGAHLGPSKPISWGKLHNTELEGWVNTTKLVFLNSLPPNIELHSIAIMASIRRSIIQARPNHRALFSTTARVLQSSPSAAETATAFLSQHTNTVTTNQSLDSNQANLLHATLDRPAPTSPILAPGYHLAYFTPTIRTKDLGNDGTDTSYNPMAPSRFIRRMWAGGEMSWSNPGTSAAIENSSEVKGKGWDDGGYAAADGGLLSSGQEVREDTKVLSAKATKTGKGDEMVVVSVQKSFTTEGAKAPAVVDRRDWLFLLPAPEPSSAVTDCAIVSTQPGPKPQMLKEATTKYGFRHWRDHYQTPASLFRFSALTFNAHRIHYDAAYASTEGHRGAVVHGPLNLVLMLDLWRDVKTTGQDGGEVTLPERDAEPIFPKRISYRNTKPLYAGSWYRIGMAAENEGKTEMRVVDENGATCVKGVVESW